MTINLSTVSCVDSYSSEIRRIFRAPLNSSQGMQVGVVWVSELPRDTFTTNTVSSTELFGTEVTCLPGPLRRSSDGLIIYYRGNPGRT
jgi:hypothetical protein